MSTFGNICTCHVWHHFENLSEKISVRILQVTVNLLSFSNLGCPICWTRTYFKTIDVYIEHAHGSHMLVTSLWRHIEQDFLIREVVIQLINQIGQKTANQFKIKCTSGTWCSLCTALDNSLPQMSHKIWVIPFFYGSEPTKKTEQMLELAVWCRKRCHSGIPLYYFLDWDFKLVN